MGKKKKLLRCLEHIPVGLMAVFLGYVGWVYAVVFAFGFIVYEVTEDLHLKDGAYIDIYGFLWGLAVGGIGLFAWQLLVSVIP